MPNIKRYVKSQAIKQPPKTGIEMTSKAPRINAVVAEFALAAHMTLDEIYEHPVMSDQQLGDTGYSLTFLAIGWMQQFVHFAKNERLPRQLAMIPGVSLRPERFADDDPYDDRGQMLDFGNSTFSDEEITALARQELDSLALLARDWPAEEEAQTKTRWRVSVEWPLPKTHHFRKNP